MELINTRSANNNDGEELIERNNSNLAYYCAGSVFLISNYLFQLTIDKVVTIISDPIVQWGPT